MSDAHLVAELLSIVQQLDRQIAGLKAQLEPQPCGHPAACIRNGRCGWCADIDEAKRNHELSQL